MVFPKKALFFSFITLLTASPINAAVDSTFHIYLLFGQSNMAGGGAGNQNDAAGLLATDCDTNTRIKTLAFCNCASTDYSLKCSVYKPTRVDSLWYTAFQPIHICTEGISPGEYFARTMLDSIRSDIKIGLIPCALSGQALNVFFPGGSGFNIPTWAHPTLVNSSPYAWMLARCKRAQKTGVIKGILLHQGESGAGSPPALSWVAMATAIMDSLKKNLGLPSTLPVVVGELRQDAV
ncbi:MAG: sialate O-acetylesterase, partial [Chitinispirillaceae bacterium]